MGISTVCCNTTLLIRLEGSQTHTTLQNTNTVSLHKYTRSFLKWYATLVHCNVVVHINRHTVESVWKENDHYRYLPFSSTPSPWAENYLSIAITYSCVHIYIQTHKHTHKQTYKVQEMLGFGSPSTKQIRETLVSGPATTLFTSSWILTVGGAVEEQSRGYFCVYVLEC